MFYTVLDNYLGVYVYLGVYLFIWCKRGKQGKNAFSRQPKTYFSNYSLT